MCISFPYVIFKLFPTSDNLHLSDRDIDSLYRDFRKIDKNKQQRITYDNYCIFLKVKPLPLLSTIFHYFSMCLDALVFPEFVLLATFFLSLDEIGLAQFLHLLLFDTNFSTAYLKAKNVSFDTTERQFQLLLGSTWGNTENIKKIIRKMGGVDHSIGAINNQSFVNYCLKNRSLLNLIVTHHLTLKRKIHTIGTKNNWEERTPESGGIWDGRSGIGNHLMNEIKRIKTVLHKIENNENCDDMLAIPVAVPIPHGQDSIAVHEASFA